MWTSNGRYAHHVNTLGTLGVGLCRSGKTGTCTDLYYKISICVHSRNKTYLRLMRSLEYVASILCVVDEVSAWSYQADVPRRVYSNPILEPEIGIETPDLAIQVPLGYT